MAQTYTVKAGDTLNSIAGRFGYKNYKEAGITSVPSGNFDLIKPGDVITINGAPVNAGTPNVAPTTTNPPDLDSAINGAQDNEIGAYKGAEVEVRGAPLDQGLTGTYDSISDLLKGNLPEKPETISLEDTYKSYRKKYGLDTLEKQLADLTDQENELTDTLLATKTQERNKPVAMNVISGRISQHEQNYNEKVAPILRQKAYISTQIQGANDAIDTIMKYKETDYNNAKDDYHDQFENNLSIFNAVQGYLNTQTDNARANLQIMYNAIKDGDVDFSKLDPTTKLQFSRLEAQAGLPVGFWSAFSAQNPNGKPVSTTTREAGGKKYVDVVYIDKTSGKPYVYSTFLGETSGGEDTIKLTNEDRQKLIGVGILPNEISSLESDLRLYGLQAVLDGLSDPAQKSALQAIFSSGREL